MKVNRSIAVVYESPSARQRAVCFCDDLVKRVWALEPFDVSWWSFSQLEDTSTAMQASDKACEAELIVFAVQPDGELPPEVTAWIETWVQRRGDREGSLIGLLETENEISPKHFYLRAVAHRGGMDYLTEIPYTRLEGIPDELEYCTERAHQVTGVLEEILTHQRSPRAPLM